MQNSDPRILAVATAVPPQRFTQQEALQLAGYTSPAAHRIFLNSDIDYRHFYIRPSDKVPHEDPDELHQRYKEGAVLLARQAAENCLAKAGMAAQEIDCILVCSSTGDLCPDLATILFKEMQLSPRVQRGTLLGLGCAGALPLLQRGVDHAVAYPDHRVLLVAVEICSAAYFLDDTLETVVGNAICSDGAAACLLTLRQAQGKPDAANVGPRITSFATVLDPNCQSSVGFAQRQGKLRIILSPRIRELAPPMIDRVLDELLLPRGLRRSDIRFWCLHPGGRKVIDQVQQTLGLSDEDVSVSRHILRNYGNMSSATVLFVLEEIARSGRPRPGDRGVLVVLGPGFAAEAALLEW
ncbi:MAG: type III polyketide synthase [Acidobacteria bacterium]|nr:type III polyketide synthase [Acidobacteriota bacterium]